MPRKLSLQRLIEGSKKAGACLSALEKISQYSTVEEASQDEDAPSWVFWYCLNVKGGRYRTLEHIILKSPEYAARYARQIIEGRWDDAEFIIYTDLFSSFYYARFVLNKRFELGEPKIMTAPYFAFWYSAEILKQRWEDAEPFIRQNELLWKDYCKLFRIEESVGG